MLDISRMMCLSTGHVTKETAGILDGMANGMYHGVAGLTVYSKDDVGWFLYFTDNLDIINKMPQDLQTVLKFALDHKCNIVCLDADYEPLPYLQSYDW